MRRVSKSFQDAAFLAAALEGLELQRKRIEEQIGQVRALLGRRIGSASKSAAPAAGARGRRQLSAAARRRIAAAQKKRWAEYRKKAAQKAAAK